jgi:hypothetical protein
MKTKGRVSPSVAEANRSVRPLLFCDINRSHKAKAGGTPSSHDWLKQCGCYKDLFILFHAAKLSLTNWWWFSQSRNLQPFMETKASLPCSE